MLEGAGASGHGRRRGMAAHMTSILLVLIPASTVALS